MGRKKYGLSNNDSLPRYVRHVLWFNLIGYDIHQRYIHWKDHDDNIKNNNVGSNILLPRCFIISYKLTEN